MRKELNTELVNFYSECSRPAERSYVPDDADAEVVNFFKENPSDNQAARQTAPSA